MKYTIIDSDKNTRFVQGDFDSLEAAFRRRAHLEEKFPNRFALAVVGVDDDGAFHELSEKSSDNPSDK